MSDFPDYKAALRKHRESRLPLISGAQCDDEMAAVKILVDAALGDTVLYEVDRTVASNVYLGSVVSDIIKEGVLVRVWPKENNDE